PRNAGTTQGCLAPIRVLALARSRVRAGRRCRSQRDLTQLGADRAARRHSSDPNLPQLLPRAGFGEVRRAGSSAGGETGRLARFGGRTGEYQTSGARTGIAAG